MKHIFLTLFSVAAISILISSCRCSCTCRKEIRYVITKAENRKNDSVFAVKVFGPFVNYYTQVILDSLQAFRDQYESDTVRILQGDSLIHADHSPKISCDATSRYTNLGFECDCAK
jgi:hypothetical protein